MIIQLPDGEINPFLKLDRAKFSHLCSITFGRGKKKRTKQCKRALHMLQYQTSSTKGRRQVGRCGNQMIICRYLGNRITHSFSFLFSFEQPRLLFLFPKIMPNIHRSLSPPPLNRKQNRNMALATCKQLLELGQCHFTFP